MIDITQPGTTSAQKIATGSGEENPEGEVQNDKDDKLINESYDPYRGPLTLDFDAEDNQSKQLCKSCLEKQAALAPPKRPLSPYIFFS